MGKNERTRWPQCTRAVVYLHVLMPVLIVTKEKTLQQAEVWPTFLTSTDNTIEWARPPTSHFFFFFFFNEIESKLSILIRSVVLLTNSKSNKMENNRFTEKRNKTTELNSRKRWTWKIKKWKKKERNYIKKKLNVFKEENCDRSYFKTRM